jgi:hypothetical protein
MSIASHERRIAALECPAKSELDPLVLVLETLNDNELGLVTEFRSLIIAGFQVEEIQDMMAPDAYLVAINAMEKVDQELQRLEQPVRPKRRGKRLRPARGTYVDPGADSSYAEVN